MKSYENNRNRIAGAVDNNSSGTWSPEKETSGKEAEIDTLRARIQFLEQFAPKDYYGAPNKKGKPKIFQRCGCYVSSHGRKPQFLNPDGNGYEQLEFDF